MCVDQDDENIVIYVCQFAEFEKKTGCKFTTAYCRNYLITFM